MNRKYELVTTDTLVVDGRKLYRIKALRDLRNGLIRAGDLGGYVESTHNLSDNGTAWIYAPAQVYGEAQVKDNATAVGNSVVRDSATLEGFSTVFDAEVAGSAVVSGRASVRGHSRVFGLAKVCENAQIDNMAQVFGQGKVGGSAIVSGSSTYVHGKASVAGSAKIDAGEIAGDARVHGQARVRGMAKARRETDVMVFDGPELISLTAYRTVHGDVELVHTGFMKLCQHGFQGSLEMFREDVKRGYPCTPDDHVGWYYLGLANLIEYSFSRWKDSDTTRVPLPPPSEVASKFAAARKAGLSSEMSLAEVVRSYGLVELAKMFGMDGALQALRNVDNGGRFARLYALWCAREVLHLSNDWRSEKAIEVAERYANGRATLKELKKAYEQAGEVVEAAWQNRAREKVNRSAAGAAFGCAYPDILEGVRRASSGAAAATTVSSNPCSVKYRDEVAATQLEMLSRLAGIAEG